mgnify:CR=1 FL=1
MAIDGILEKHGKVGFWDDEDAQKQAVNEIDDYLYDEIAQPDGDAPLDLDTFLANPAEVRIGAFNATRGEEVWFTKDDMRTVEVLQVAKHRSNK